MIIAAFIISAFVLLGAILLFLFIRSDAYQIEKAIYERNKRAPKP